MVDEMFADELNFDEDTVRRSRRREDESDE
jgi:hypothetical protein